MQRAEPRTDLRQAAAALRYRSAQGAPIIVAKGQGLIAEEIIRRAQEAGVYVHSSPELVGLLMQVDLDERIPPRLYSAVAEVLAWIWQLEREQRGDAPLNDPLDR
ncbi:MAG: EscU/YscU/HrcU family type III secretion system export apparatus switch protein [Betaproteobacteria bacterium]|nr:EscU/YscU/HrcU family type III secretion system export apparatus switch protein [Betaproteobacteria bacterium]